MKSLFKIKSMEIDAAQREMRRLRAYREADRYYQGKGNVILPPKFSESMKSRYPKLRANYCDVVVEAMVSRLNVTNIRCEDKTVSKYLQRVWRDSKMDLRHIKNIRQSIKRGDSFLLVWPDSKTKRSQIHVLDASTCFPFYLDDEGTLLYFKRQFIGFDMTGTPAMFKYMYYHDRLERFYSPVSSSYSSSRASALNTSITNWKPYDQDGFESVIKHPYGIPIVHFTNKQDESPFGESEISGIFGLNDAINSQFINLMRVGEFSGFKQGILTGANRTDFPQDFEGKPRIDINAGDFLVFTNPEAKAWSLDQSSPDGILAIIDKLVDTIAQTSRTPKGILETPDGVASGLAMEKVEGPLTSKCSGAQISFGSCYEEVNKLIVSQARILGERIPEIDAYAEWEPLSVPSPADNLTKAQTLVTYKDSGIVSKGYIQRELGLTEEEILRVNEELAKDGEDDLSRLLSGMEHGQRGAI